MCAQDTRKCERASTTAGISIAERWRNVAGGNAPGTGPQKILAPRQRRWKISAMSSTHLSLHFHVVFGTKHQRPLIAPAQRNRQPVYSREARARRPSSTGTKIHAPNWRMRSLTPSNSMQTTRPTSRPSEGRSRSSRRAAGGPTGHLSLQPACPRAITLQIL